MPSNLTAPCLLLHKPCGSAGLAQAVQWPSRPQHALSQHPFTRVHTPCLHTPCLHTLLAHSHTPCLHILCLLTPCLHTLSNSGTHTLLYLRNAKARALSAKQFLHHTHTAQPTSPSTHTLRKPRSRNGGSMAITPWVPSPTTRRGSCRQGKEHAFGDPYCDNM